MPTLRGFRPADLDQLYAISLATGDAGRDAWHLYIDGRLIGHIYSAPYAKLSPETVLVVEDEQGVGGYIVGVFDTPAFETRLEQEWWPGLRPTYPEPTGASSTWTADQRRSFMIHRPRPTPETLVTPYPAHLHMNLLPRLQGKGLGTALLEAWLTMARKARIRGVHLGANAGNHAALRFWASRGFQRLEPPVVPVSETSVWFGRRL